MIKFHTPNDVTSNGSSKNDHNKKYVMVGKLETIIYGSFGHFLVVTLCMAHHTVSGIV